MEHITPDHMEHVSCPLCGGDRNKKLFDAADIKHGVSGRFSFVRCASCRLIFQNPRIKSEFRDLMYPRDYEPYHHGRGSVLDDPARLAATIPRYEILEKYCARPGALLDVGSASGDFIEYAASRGWDAWGVEPSAPQDAVPAGAAAGVFRSDLADADIPASRFDAVTFWASLEHMHDPLGALQAAHRILKPRGVTILSLPNGDSLERRLFGPAWFGLDTPRHQILPSPAAARAFLERAGFEILDIKHATTATCFVQSVRGLASGNAAQKVPAPEPPPHGPARPSVKQSSARALLFSALSLSLKAVDALGMGALMLVAARKK